MIIVRLFHTEKVEPFSVTGCGSLYNPLASLFVNKIRLKHIFVTFDVVNVWRVLSLTEVQSLDCFATQVIGCH